MDCAPPLYFDPTLNVCNWPEMVDCQIKKRVKRSAEENSTDSATTEEELTTIVDEQITTEEADTTTEEEVTTTEVVKTTTEEAENTTEVAETTTESFDIVCPLSTDGFPVFLPYPKDCTKYYECVDEVPVLMDCAPPLYFDPTLNVCNWPEMVDCQIVKKVKRSIEKNLTDSPNTTEEAATTEEEQTTTAEEQTTAEEADTTTKEAENTTEIAETTTEVVETTTEEAETTTEVAETTTDSFHIVCPLSTDGFPVFLPHPTDCTKYYECVDEVPVLMDCAPPLYFDPTLNVCNWPEMVDCK